MLSATPIEKCLELGQKTAAVRLSSGGKRDLGVVV